MKTLGLFLFFSLSLVFADSNSFSVVGMPEPEPGKNEIPSLESPQVQNQLINDLKQKAVVQWLENYLTGKFAAYEKSITPDFGEKYVLDYKVARVQGQANTLELTGHVDADGLRKWTRLYETKEKGPAAIRPLFIFSANAQTLQSNPKDTLDRTKDWPLAQILHKEVSQQFQKLNARLLVLENKLMTSSPPTFENDVSSFAGELASMNANTVVWLHVSQCPSCPTARLEMYLYSLSPARLATVKSEDVGLNSSALTQAEKAKKALEPFLPSVREGIDETVAEGKLFSRDLTLRIEGIDAYRSYKNIEKDLQKQDYLSHPSLRLVEATAAEFGFVSSTSPEELAQRMQSNQWNGYKLQAVRVDSDTIVMRYLR